MKLIMITAVFCSALMAACSNGSEGADSTGTSTLKSSTSEAVSTTRAPQTTTTVAPTTVLETTTTVPPPVTMPGGQPVFDGYPKLVAVDSVDPRVANWLRGKAPTGELVALAPGVYTPYNPNIPDLLLYLDLPNDGDCAMRKLYFPGSGGACWTGVS